MKKIKSYTSIWSVEKVIYAINDFQLPFPVTFSQMAWFVVSLFVVILFGELPPFNMIWIFKILCEFFTPTKSDLCRKSH